MRRVAALVLLLQPSVAADSVFTHCKPLGPCYMECKDGEACGEVPPAVPDAGGAKVVMSDNKGLRMNVTSPVWQSDKPSGLWIHSIDVDQTQTFQTFLGLGGAFTDAAAINLANTTEAARDAVLDSYYGPNGARYTMGRVPVGSCDFSTHKYDYIEVGDYNLSTFALAPEDTGPLGKIHFIKEAQKRINAFNPAPLQLFASAWTAPPFLKANTTSKDPWSGGSLSPDPKARDTWANYFARFMTEYKALGVEFWGMTLQNEPTPLPGPLQQKWETMFYSGAEQGEFLAGHLGPVMRAAHPSVKLLAHDDQKAFLSSTLKSMLAVPNVTKYLDGIGVHWYMLPGAEFGAISDAQAVLDKAITERACIILGTEACAGFSAILSPPHAGTDLGNWERGQAYGKDILGDLNAGAVAWTDWNLVLDMAGGPNHAGNLCDAPILIDTANPGKYYKNPMYYYLSHFSAYIPRGSKRIAFESHGPAPMETTAWKTPDGHVVLVVLNRDYATGRSFYVHDPVKGYLTVHVEAASIVTIVY
eukprot:Hpha_TRINITY_DN14969_c0_g1::TRINITY_DN14969_c0_g1_i7::g.143196::m.143196/K01201/GBA, srfJ; glucosylceramidase